MVYYSRQTLIDLANELSRLQNEQSSKVLECTRNMLQPMIIPSTWLGKLGLKGAMSFTNLVSDLIFYKGIVDESYTEAINVILEILEILAEAEQMNTKLLQSFDMSLYPVIQELQTI